MFVMQPNTDINSGFNAVYKVLSVCTVFAGEENFNYIANKKK